MHRHDFSQRSAGEDDIGKADDRYIKSAGYAPSAYLSFLTP